MASVVQSTPLPTATAVSAKAFDSSAVNNTASTEKAKQAVTVSVAEVTPAGNEPLKAAPTVPDGYKLVKVRKPDGSIVTVPRPINKDVKTAAPKTDSTAKSTTTSPQPLQSVPVQLPATAAPTTAPQSLNTTPTPVALESKDATKTDAGTAKPTNGTITIPATAAQSPVPVAQTPAVAPAAVAVPKRFSLFKKAPAKPAEQTLLASTPKKFLPTSFVKKAMSNLTVENINHVLDVSERAMNIGHAIANDDINKLEKLTAKDSTTKPSAPASTANAASKPATTAPVSTAPVPKRIVAVPPTTTASPVPKAVVAIAPVVSAATTAPATVVMPTHVSAKSTQVQGQLPVVQVVNKATTSVSPPQAARKPPEVRSSTPSTHSNPPPAMQAQTLPAQVPGQAQHSQIHHPVINSHSTSSPSTNVQAPAHHVQSRDINAPASRYGSHGITHEKDDIEEWDSSDEGYELHEHSLGDNAVASDHHAPEAMHQDSSQALHHAENHSYVQAIEHDEEIEEYNRETDELVDEHEETLAHHQHDDDTHHQEAGEEKYEEYDPEQDVELEEHHGEDELNHDENVYYQQEEHQDHGEDVYGHGDNYEQNDSEEEHSFEHEEDHYGEHEEDNGGSYFNDDSE